MKLLIPPVLQEPNIAEHIRNQPEIFLRQCAAKHGDVFTVVVEQGNRITYVLDPQLFHPLLTAPQIDFSPVSRQSKLRFGLGRVVATEEDVRELSSALAYALRGSRLKAALEVFDQSLIAAVQTYADTIRKQGSVRCSIQDLARQTLMPATAKALFGPGIYDEDFPQDFLTYAASVATRFTGSNPALDEQGVAAEAALMQRLKKVGQHNTPVLRTLSDRLFSNATFTEAEQLRTLLMLMWGSLVNLLPTSIWMYASVIRDPELVETLRQDEGTTLRKSIVTETLRLFSRPNIYREITEDFELARSDGRRVQFTRGDWIALFPRFLHHDPDVFQQEKRFEAQRFCPNQHTNKAPIFLKNGEPLRHSTVVFGLGRGRCPGDVYSLSVLERLLMTWVSTFDASAVDTELPAALEKTVSSTPGPERPISVILKIRVGLNWI